MACKEGQFDVVELINLVCINLNAPHVNGMAHFEVFKVNFKSFQFSLVCVTVVFLILGIV